MRKITKEQLEDLIVTVYEGGSGYWLGLDDEMIDRIGRSGNIPFSVKMTEYLWSGNKILISDAEDISTRLGTLHLIGINKAFNDPICEDSVKDFIDEDYDIWTTDVIIQHAIFGEVVYG